MLGLLVGFGVTLVSALIPAIRATKIPPMAGLREGATLPRGRFARFSPVFAILFALAGTWAAERFDPRFDGVASLGISVLLAGISIILVRESKGLLIGEAAEPALRDGVTRIVADTDGVIGVNGLITSHLAPDEVVAAVSVDFADDLDVGRVEVMVDDMDARVRAAHPEVVALFVKPQARSSYEEARRRRVDPPESAED